MSSCGDVLDGSVDTGALRRFRASFFRAGFCLGAVAVDGTFDGAFSGV
jgi:hypothetical protein